MWQNKITGMNTILWPNKLDHYKDVVGNTRVIITVNDIGLDIINNFLFKNINQNMDILFGNRIISSSVPIRTDHFSKDIIISFKDKKLAKEFYIEYGEPQL